MTSISGLSPSLGSLGRPDNEVSARNVTGAGNAGLSGTGGMPAAIPSSGTKGGAAVDLTPQPAQVSDPQGSSQRLAEAVRQLGQVFPGDLSRLLGEVMIKMAAAQRQDALDSRTMAYAAQKAAALDQAGEIRDAAAKMMQGAITSLVLTSVSSGISVAGGMVAAAGQVKSLSGMAKAGGNDQLFKMAEQTSSLFASVNSISRSVGDIGSGAGASGSKILDAQSKADEADAQVHAAEGAQAAQAGDFAKEIQQNMKETMQAIVAFLKELADAEVEQMRVVTRA